MRSSRTSWPGAPCARSREEPVAREDLEAVVACGQWAPSAHEPAGVVRSSWWTMRGSIARLAEVMRVVAGPRRVRHVPARPPSCWWRTRRARRSAARTTAAPCRAMMLAAHSLGLGSVWINQLQGICDEPAVRTELDALGLPGDHRGPRHLRARPRRRPRQGPRTHEPGGVGKLVSFAIRAGEAQPTSHVIPSGGGEAVGVEGPLQAEGPSARSARSWRRKAALAAHGPGKAACSTSSSSTGFCLRPWRA